MNHMATAELGLIAAQREIASRGGREVTLHKEGNRRLLTFVGHDGHQYKVITRSKTKGDWQTSIKYGEKCGENPIEREYWLFVDLGFDPPKFYPVPLWWIKNDIYGAHQRYLDKHGGHRARNDKSSHHSVRLPRIQRWESEWSEMGL